MKRRHYSSNHSRYPLRAVTRLISRSCPAGDTPGTCMYLAFVKVQPNDRSEPVLDKCRRDSCLYSCLVLVPYQVSRSMVRTAQSGQACRGDSPFIIPLTHKRPYTLPPRSLQPSPEPRSWRLPGPSPKVSSVLPPIRWTVHAPAPVVAVSPVKHSFIVAVLHRPTVMLAQ